MPIRKQECMKLLMPIGEGEQVKSLVVGENKFVSDI